MFAVPISAQDFLYLTPIYLSCPQRQSLFDEAGTALAQSMSNPSFNMAPLFNVIEHSLPGQHIRESPKGTKHHQEDTLQFCIKQYIPASSLQAETGTGLTIIGVGGNGFPKVQSRTPAAFLRVSEKDYERKEEKKPPAASVYVGSKYCTNVEIRRLTNHSLKTFILFLKVMEYLCVLSGWQIVPIKVRAARQMSLCKEMIVSQSPRLMTNISLI